MKIDKTKIIFLTFIFLTLGNSKFFIDKGINSYIEIISYILLIFEIWILFLKNSSRVVLKSTLFRFLMIFILFSIGIFLQPLSLLIKIRLIFTMFIIATLLILSKNYMNSLRNIRCASYGILIGTFIAIILSILGNVKLMEISYEGILDFGFNGG